MKRFISFAILILFISFIGIKIKSAIQNTKNIKTKGRKNRKKGAVAVEVRPIIKEDIIEQRIFTGSIIPKSQFIISPKISGKLKKLHVNIGDIIKNGQLIAEIEDTEYIHKIAQARAELEIAKANLDESISLLEISKRELERVKTLCKKKISSASDLDVATAQYKTKIAKKKINEAQVNFRISALKSAEMYLGYTKIHATWEDNSKIRVIGEKFLDQGALLSPNSKIVSVLEIDTVIAVINVIEKDYLKFQINQKAQITTDAIPKKVFNGKVARIAPILKKTSRQARIEIKIQNQNFLIKPGMFVKIIIQFNKHTSATIIPFNALVRRHGKRGIFLVNKDEAIFKQIEPGIINGDKVEILKPELSGFVITLGHHLLDNNSKIIIPNNKNKKGD